MRGKRIALSFAMAVALMCGVSPAFAAGTFPEASSIANAENGGIVLTVNEENFPQRLADARKSDIKNIEELKKEVESRAFGDRRWEKVSSFLDFLEKNRYADYELMSETSKDPDSIGSTLRFILDDLEKEGEGIENILALVKKLDGSGEVYRKFKALQSENEAAIELVKKILPAFETAESPEGASSSYSSASSGSSLSFGSNASSASPESPSSGFKDETVYESDILSEIDALQDELGGIAEEVKRYAPHIPALEKRLKRAGELTREKVGKILDEVKAERERLLKRSLVEAGALDFDGVFVRYGDGKFDWLYIKRNTGNVYKLEGVRNGKFDYKRLDGIFGEVRGDRARVDVQPPLPGSSAPKIDKDLLRELRPVVGKFVEAYPYARFTPPAGSGDYFESGFDWVVVTPNGGVFKLEGFDKKAGSFFYTRAPAFGRVESSKIVFKEN